MLFFSLWLLDYVYMCFVYMYTYMHKIIYKYMYSYAYGLKIVMKLLRKRNSTNRRGREGRDQRIDLIKIRHILEWK